MYVDKYPVEAFRSSPRMTYPNYEGLEWAANKAKWPNPYDTYSVPTGMFKDQAGCNNNPVTVVATIFNKLGRAMPPKRNPA